MVLKEQSHFQPDKGGLHWAIEVTKKWEAWARMGNKSLGEGVDDLIQGSWQKETV